MVTRTLLPEVLDELDEPRDDQEGGSVGVEFEGGSEMNWKLTSIREHGQIQSSHSKRCCQGGQKYWRF